MLPQRMRLRQATDIALIRKEGQSWRHPLLILLARQNNIEVSRFGMIASRRIGNAVVRNRAKRLLRESVRADLDLIKPGWDCLLIARRAMTTVGFAEVQTAVHHLMEQANLLVGECS